MADRAPWGLVVIHYRDPAAVHRLLVERDTWSAAPAVTVVVDNSGDLESSGVDAIVTRPGANLGYAGAANRGVSAVLEAVPRALRVLVCTQDAALESATAAGLLAVLETDPRVAVAGPMLAYATARDVVFSAGGRLSRNGLGTHPGQGVPLASIDRGTVEVDWVDGAITMIDLAALQKVGGFDPRYFLYVEEIDLQTRLRVAGYRIMMNRTVLGFQEPGAYPTYLKYRNNVYFTRKLRARLRRWPVAHQFARDTVRAIAGRRAFDPLWACRGVFDGARGRMGMPPATLLGRGREALDVG